MEGAPAAVVPAGFRYVRYVPADTTPERYLRVNATLGGTTPTVTVSSWITDQEPANIFAYPDAIN